MPLRLDGNYSLRESWHCKTNNAHEYSLVQEYKDTCNKYNEVFSRFTAAKIRVGKYAKNPPAKWEYAWMEEYGIDHAQAFKDSCSAKDKNRYWMELESVHSELKKVSKKRKMLRCEVEKIENKIREEKMKLSWRREE